MRWGRGFARIRKGRATAVLVAAGMLLPLFSCTTLPPPGKRGDLAGASTVVLRARIVDMNSEAGTLTVKEADRFETWTVAIVDSTGIRNPRGESLGIGDLRVGDRVEIRGTSRISQHVTAYEISILDERPETRSGTYGW